MVKIWQIPWFCHCNQIQFIACEPSNQKQNKNTYEDLLQYVADYYQCSLGEAEEYIDIIREAGVRGILWEMGVNEKETDKLIKKAKL